MPTVIFTAKDVDTAHRFRGFSCWGYHYYVRKSGQIEPMRDEDMVGAHARGYNSISLGVCFEGGLDANGKPADTRTRVRKRLCIAWWENCYSVIPKRKLWDTGI